ncbi:hypothetical protein FRC06_006316 [Ceratobasidium sp. 370]|nr:hypothetical protein FRC06_006316 [Ceratobasidium sp. 370]
MDPDPRPSRIELPTEWRDEWLPSRAELTRLLNQNPRYECSWNPFITAIITGTVFQPHTPDAYYWKDQPYLRRPINPVVIQPLTPLSESNNMPDLGDSAESLDFYMDIDQPSSSNSVQDSASDSAEDGSSNWTQDGSSDWTQDSSVDDEGLGDAEMEGLDDADSLDDDAATIHSNDSYGIPVRSRLQGREEGLLKPDYVLAQNCRGQQVIVAVIEIKPRASVTPRDGRRFRNYARRLLEMGTPASHAAMLLIAGGIAYVWWPDELHELSTRDVIGNQYLAARQAESMCVLVDTLYFLRLMARIRNRLAVVL